MSDRTTRNGVGVDDDLLTTSQAAALLGVSKPTLIDLLDRDEIPCQKVGTRRYVRRGDVIAYRHRIDPGLLEKPRPRPERLLALREMAQLAEDTLDR